MTDYTINGVAYTEDTLKTEAEKRGLDLETYKSKLKKKHGENFQNDPAAAETSVGSKTNTVSKSDPGSSDLPKIPKQIGTELDGVTLDDIKKNTKEAEKIKTDNIYNKIGSNAFAGTVEEKVEIFNSFGKQPKLVEAGVPGFVETKIQNEDFLDGFNLIEFQNRWVSETGEATKNNAINQGIDVNKQAKDNGIIFLNKNDKAVRNLEINLKGANKRGDVEMAKDLEIKLAEARTKVNAGSRLYDPVTGSFENLEKLSPQGQKIEQDANVLSIASDLNSLEEMRTKEYYELIALSKEALNRFESIGKERTGVEKLIGPIRGLFTEDTYGFDKEVLQQIANTETLPENITSLPGEHPIALAFNAKLNKYTTLNRAIELNSDPVTTERTNELTKNLNRFVKNVSNRDVLGSEDTDAAVNIFKEIVNENGVGYADQMMVDTRSKTTITDAILGMTVDLAPLIATVVVAKKAPGYAQAEKGLANLSNFLKQVGPKSSAYRGLINTTFGLGTGSSAVKEMATLGAADEIGAVLIGAEAVDPVFAASLGAGQSLAQQGMGKLVEKRLEGKLKFITPVLAALNKSKGATKYIQGVQGATIGTATMVVAEGVSLQYNSLMEEGKFAEAEELLELGTPFHLAETYYSLRLVGLAGSGLTKAIGKDILALKNQTTETNAAAKLLNISKNVSKELTPTYNVEGSIIGAKKINRIQEIEQAEQLALEKLKKEYMPKGEGSSETFADGSYVKKVKEIRDAAQTLKTQYNLVLDQDQVKRDEDNAASNTELYVTTERLKRGSKLDTKDLETIAKTPESILLDQMGAGNNLVIKENIKKVTKYANEILNVVDSQGFKGESKQRTRAIKLLQDYATTGSKIKSLENQLKSQPNLRPVLEREIEFQKNKNEKTLEDYNSNLKESQDLAGKEISETKDVFERAGIKNTIELNATEFQKKVNELEPGKDASSTSGVIDRATGELYINAPFSKTMQSRGVTVHEQTHNIVKESLRGKDGKITKEGLQVINQFREGLNPTEKKLIDQRINENYKFDENGKERPYEEYAEEYVTVFGDLIRDKRIKFKNKIEATDASSIKSGAELKNLIRRINEEVDKGKLSQDVIDAANKKQAGEGIDQSRDIAKIKTLETEFRDVKKAEKSRKESFLKRAKEIEKDQPEVAKRMREKVDEMSNKEGALVRKIAKEYSTSIKAIVRKNPSVLDTPTYENFTSTEAKLDAIVEQTMPELIKHINNFKDFNTNLDAYINSYLVKKIGTATSKKGFRKEEFTSRLDNEAFKIAAEIDGPIEIIKSEQSEFKKTIKPTNEQRVDILQKSVDVLVKNLNKIDANVKGQPRPFYTNAKKQVEKELFKLVKNRLNTLNPKGYRALMNTKQGVESVLAIDLLTMTNSLKGGKGGFDLFLEPVLKLDGTQERYSKEEANKLGIPYEKAGSGPLKYKKRSINDFIKDGEVTKEFTDWVLDKNNAKPRIDGKKDAIAKALAGNLGLDAMMGGVKTPVFEIKKNEYVDLLKNATPEQKVLIKTDAFLSKLSDKITRNQNISFSVRKQTEKFMSQLEKLTNDQSRIELFESQNGTLKDIFNRIIPGGVVNTIKEIDKTRLKLESEAADRITREEGIPYSEAILRVNQEIKNYSSLRKNKKTVQLPNDPVIQKRILQGLIPKGMKLGDLSKDVQQQIYSEMQGGNTRFIIDGRKLTYLDFATELKAKLKKEGRDSTTPMAKNNPAPKESTYADLFEVAYGKDATIGTKPMGKNKDGSVKSIDGAKFYSNWGGISRQFESIINKNLKEYGDTSKARLETKKEIENYMAKEGFTIDQTIAANRVMLERKYDVLIDMFIEKPTTKMLGKIIDALQPLTNQATSISKGNIPMTLVNMFSEVGPKYNSKGKELKQEKIRHNEHLLEFFQMNSRFVDLLDNYKNKKINKTQLREQTVNLLRQAEQASTSEFQRYNKDKTGPSTSDALSTIEFLFKKNKAKDVITIGSSREGSNLAESVSKTLNPKQRQIVKNTPNSKLTTEGVMVKQRVVNVKEYEKVKINNEKIAKKAGVSYSDSKKMNQGELFETLKNIDKNNAEKINNKFSEKDLSKEFNNILEQSSGVESVKEFSDIRAKTTGRNKRKWQLFIPDSAADLNGLIDVTLGKGKTGDAQRKWYKENIIDPFNKAEDALVRDRVALTSGFKALKKQLKVVPKDLRKEAIEGFTFEQAIRVHTWNKQGMKVEGLSKRDLKELSEIIEKNPELNAFSEQLIELGKGEGYPAPPKDWLAGSISTDLRTGLNRGGRAKYLEATGYTENIGKIYSKENLNKLEALYGNKYRVALENMLGRMRTGINRKPSANALENRALDWINNANGVTMFLNARSAVLQTISSLNYINWTDNNPLKAGKALANQPQYWKDFMEIMNSDYLVDRRNGLKLNVSESEIADAAKSSTNSAKGAISYLLSKGFLFTRIADSFAIASGGSTFYRNRINTYKKQGLSEAQAKEKAFKDFKEISEVSQQSANVTKISMEQSSSLGRLVLAFANTPMQYARLQKSAIKDLANGRGDYKTNFSKVMYYGFVQNLMFNALQNALFTNIWEDNPDPIKEDMKKARIANGMADSILRGMGIGGAAFSTIKNVMLKVKSESEKSRPDYNKAASEVFDFIPPIDTKIRKLRNTATSFKYDIDDMRNMSLTDIDNPVYLAGANVISAATNFPADRIIRKTQNMKGVLTDEMEMWQRIARFAGWSEWEIGPNNESGKPFKLLKPPVLKIRKPKLLKPPKI